MIGKSLNSVISYYPIGHALRGQFFRSFNFRTQSKIMNFLGAHFNKFPEWLYNRD